MWSFRLVSIREPNNFRPWRNKGQTIEELWHTLHQPWSTIQEHLQEIGKVSRAGVEIQKKTIHHMQLNTSTTQYKTIFLIIWSLEMKSGSYVIIQNAKGSNSIRINYHEVLLSHFYIPKNAFV